MRGFLFSFQTAVWPSDMEREPARLSAHEPQQGHGRNKEMKIATQCAAIGACLNAIAIASLFMCRIISASYLSINPGAEIPNFIIITCNLVVPTLQIAGWSLLAVFFILLYKRQK